MSDGPQDRVCLVETRFTSESVASGGVNTAIEIGVSRLRSGLADDRALFESAMAARFEHIRRTVKQETAIMETITW